MNLTITDQHMTGSTTLHTATRDAEADTWTVSWLPDRSLDRNAAISAMSIADTVARRNGHPTGKDAQLIATWAAELDITAQNAIEQSTWLSREGNH